MACQSLLRAYLFTGSFQCDRNFILIFFTPPESNHIYSYLGLFLNSMWWAIFFREFCHPSFVIEWLPTLVNQSVKLIHLCDWKDNTHIFAKLLDITAYYVVPISKVACGYHVSNQAYNCIIVAKLQYLVLSYFILVFHLCLKTFFFMSKDKFGT